MVGDLIRDWRTYVAGLIAAIAIWCWFGVADDTRSLHDQRALDSGGVTTTAAVLSYSYNENGGDPGGWTTDIVRFVDRHGRVVIATVGHHDQGPEKVTRSMRVTYDPAVPSLVRATGYLNDADDEWRPTIGGVVASVATCCAFGFAIWSVRRSRRRS